MQYAVWFVRLVFVAWMVPAGLNHFVPLFPQPLGNQPLSRELFLALIDSRLFTLVKAVELFAGLCALTGFYVPLALLMCMPVAVCVWYWDVPLQGWDSLSAIYGWAVLGFTCLMCLAYIRSYLPMLDPLARPRSLGSSQTKLVGHAVLAARLIFGAWMLANGISHFVTPLLAMPAGHMPLAVQLMTALHNSGLIDVVMAIQLVTGALVLAGLFLPLALCVVMPISVCAAYWAVILEREPIGALLGLAAVGLNALLMVACLDHYRGVLQRRPLALGETAEASA